MISNDPAYITIREAAPRLRMSEEALQTFCRRHATKRGKHVVCDIAPGVEAVKIGRLWRVRFPVAA